MNTGEREIIYSSCLWSDS